MSITLQNNRDLNQGLLHLWCKFGDPSLNGCWVIARTSKWLPHGRTDGRTHRQTQATTIPEGQNWPRIKTDGYFIGLCYVTAVFSYWPMLTHWGRDKMNAISQTTFSNAFSSMKMFEFWLKFHCSLFLRVKLTIFQHWFRKWLGAEQATSHYLNQWWLDQRRIYESLGLSELIIADRRIISKNLS